MGRVLHLGPSWHGPTFMWAELAWAELVLGRVVLHPIFIPKLTTSIFKVRLQRSGIDTIKYTPHLTQDTNGKVTNSQLDTTNESQGVSPFPAGDHKARMKRRDFTGGLKPISRGF